MDKCVGDVSTRNGVNDTFHVAADIDMSGQFYGPDADIFAGVIGGVFGGTMTIPDRENSINAGTYGLLKASIIGGFVAEEDLE